jgi:hypothetical protein
MKLERLANFRMANLRFVPLLDDSLRSFQIHYGNAEPKRPEPFLFHVRAESAPGVRRFKKDEGPNSALDLAALFTQVFHVALLSRGETQAFGLADGIGDVRDGNSTDRRFRAVLA